MRIKQMAYTLAGLAALGVFGLLAWAQRRDVVNLPVPPGRRGARQAARAYARQARVMDEVS